MDLIKRFKKLPPDKKAWAILRIDFILSLLEENKVSEFSLKTAEENCPRLIKNQNFNREGLL